MIRQPLAIALLAALLASSFPRTQEERQFVAISAATVSDADSVGIALLKRASSLHAEKQYADAIAAYDQAAERLPQLVDWIAVFSAASVSFQGDTLEVARRLAGVDETMASQWGWRARVRAFAAAGSMQRAMQVAKAATNSGTSSKRAEAWYRVAELQRDLGNRAEQRAALLQAIETAPQSGGAMDAALALVERSDLSSNDRVKAGRALLRNGQVTRGIRELERALKAGGVTNSSEVRYELGRVLFNLDRYKDAIKQLGTVARGHERRSDARFLLGRAQYRAGITTAGKRTFRDVVDAYPKTGAATRSLFFLGDIAQDEGRAADARAYFERAAAAPSKTAESAVATMRLGGFAYAQGDYTKATRIFEQYRARFATGEAHNQATYWLAQTMLRRGRDSAGNELLRELKRKAPLSYYGMRAAEQLGGSLQPEAQLGPATPTSVVSDIRDKLDRWELLREVGWYEAASFELNRLRQRLSGDRAALYAYAEELQQRDASHIAIETGRALLNAGGGWDERLLKIMYPMPYHDLIEREARARNLDPYLVAALIRQESRFNPRAKSGAGAVGLMQVMPSTGRALAARLNVGTVTAATLTDAETNIKLGTKFLADMMNMYDRRLDLVLIAYNAGPSRANRWRTFPEFAATDLFVERIPFEETRDYVKVVQLNAEIYRAVYGSRSAHR